MRFANAIRIHAGVLDNNAAVTRWGTVQSVNPADMTARVLIQPDGILSGWLPIVSPYGGGGWGMVCPPVIGQPVKLVPDGGDHENYEIHGTTWSTAGMPPGGAAPGECWLVHPTGAAVKLLNTGHVLLSDPSGSVVELQSNGTIAMTGTVAITGALIVNGHTIT